MTIHPSGRLSNRSAIITGAAKGIGFAIAKCFVEEGAQVLLTDINTDQLEAAADALGQPWLTVDVASKSSLQAMVGHGIELFGRVDILVNNAGIFRTTPLLEITEHGFDTMVAINLKSVLFAMQAVAPGMIAQGGGSIINISSLASVLASPGAIEYCATKAAVSQLTTAASLELATANIRVNAIGPGTIDTEMAAFAYADQQAKKNMLSRTPLGRAGRVEEIARTALFLASDDSSYITGKTIFVDGGRLGLNMNVPVLGHELNTI